MAKKPHKIFIKFLFFLSLELFFFRAMMFGVGWKRFQPMHTHAIMGQIKEESTND